MEEHAYNEWHEAVAKCVERALASETAAEAEAFSQAAFRIALAALRLEDLRER